MTIHYSLKIVYGLDIPVLPNLPYHFAKHLVIHEFEEVFLKLISRLSPEPGVEIYVRFQPRSLVEPNSSMNYLEDESMR